MKNQGCHVITAGEKKWFLAGEKNNRKLSTLGNLVKQKIHKSHD